MEYTNAEIVLAYSLEMMEAEVQHGVWGSVLKSFFDSLTQLTGITKDQFERSRIIRAEMDSTLDVEV